MYISLQSTLVAGRVKWPAFAELAHELGYPGTDVNISEAMAAGAPATQELLAKLKLKPAVVNLPVEFRRMTPPSGRIWRNSGRPSSFRSLSDARA